MSFWNPTNPSLFLAYATASLTLDISTLLLVRKPDVTTFRSLPYNVVYGVMHRVYLFTKFWCKGT
jgi:hypothetical protein